MAKRMELIKEKGRWILWVLAAIAIALLAGSLETGRVHAASSFTFLGALSNIVTPNGDNLNDRAILCYDNPRASEVSGTVYDLRGAKIAAMTVDTTVPGVCPGASVNGGKLLWDARSGGQKVASGIYIYQVQAEGTTITGTVMVVR